MSIKKSHAGKATLGALLTLLIAACSGGGGGGTSQPDLGTGGNPKKEALTMFEQALVGTWSRYHGYDGSTRYYEFRANRTGAKYTVENNGSRSKDQTITFWALEESRENVFRVRLAGETISAQPRGYLSKDEFDFVKNELRRGGSNLLRYRKR